MNAPASTPVRVQIDGAQIDVPPSTSIAAALALTASGRARLSVTGTARAPLCGMGECHECRVQVDGIQQLACMTPCQAGQVIRTDGAHLPPAARTPAPIAPRRCALLVIGAGPAGLQAALTAAPTGQRITVLDANPAAGGQVWRSGPHHAMPPSCQRLLQQLARFPNVELQTGARVAGLAGPVSDKALLVETATSGWVQHYEQIVLCTGARELLLPFPGWTLPGVTGAGGLQALIKQGLEVRGQRIVITGTGPLLLASAATARAAGAQVLQVAEQAAWPAVARFASGLWRWPSKAMQAATLWSPAFRPASMVLAAQGGERLESVTLRSGDHERTLACERLACGWGLVPNTRLAQLLGCALDAHGAIAVDTRLQTSVAGVYAAGECTGIGGNERAQVQGRLAAAAACAQAPAPGTEAEHASWSRFARRVGSAFALRPEVTQLAQAQTIVCRCEDVPLQALAGQDGWVQAKLQTRCGMGSCQGRICGAATQALWGWSPTAPRQLIAPVRIATLASSAPQEPSSDLS